MPENYLLVFVVLLAAGCTMPIVKPGKMNQPVFLQTDKNTYFSGETITIEFRNNSGKLVFVMNLDAQYGRFTIVKKKEDGNFDYWNPPYLFDPSTLANAAVGLPQPVKMPTGKSILGQWNGKAFYPQANEKTLEIQEKGVFKAVLSQGYSFETAPLQNGYSELKNPVTPLESNEFEIK